VNTRQVDHATVAALLAHAAAAFAEASEEAVAADAAEAEALAPEPGWVPPPPPPPGSVAEMRMLEAKEVPRVSTAVAVV